MGFSELLFTFQPFPRQPSICLSVQSFRLLSRATAYSPDLLPDCSPLSFFRFSRFRLLNKYARPARRSHTYPPAYISCPRTHTHIFTKNKPSFRRLSPYSWLSSSFRFIIILRPRVRRYGSNGYSHWQRRVFGAPNTDFLLSRSDYSADDFTENVMNHDKSLRILCDAILSTISNRKISKSFPNKGQIWNTILKTLFNRP